MRTDAERKTRNDYMRRKRKENPEQFHAWDRARYQRNKKGARDLQLRVRFGIGLKEYEELRAMQGNKCAICATDKPKGRGDWHLDHDHVGGLIRGLLCHNCNVGLGNFKDSPEVLEKAARYLRRNVELRSMV